MATFLHKVGTEKPDVENDWETESDFINDVSEKESRWGSKTVDGSGHQPDVEMNELLTSVVKNEANVRAKVLESMPKPSEGYGGKFGVQTDRVDKCAENWSYKGKVDAHKSQLDYKKGFGGQFGVDSDRKDKSAEDWTYQGKVDAHVSQKDYKKGFGGQFGIDKDNKDKSAEDWTYQGKVDAHISQKDYKKGFGGQFGIDEGRKDKSAFGWEEKEMLSKHESQKDYSTGFGGTFGVQKDRVDKCAVGWDSNEKVEKHESQTDYKKGFGGQFGVQTDRKDKSAAGWDESSKVEQHGSQKDYKKGFGGNFGVESDKQDQSAVGWHHKEEVKPHESQLDYKKGFGGQFGVQSDRKDKSAFGWNEKTETHNAHKENKTAVQAGSALNMRNRFEQMALQQKNLDKDKANEERERRKREDEELRNRQAVEERERQQKLELDQTTMNSENEGEEKEQLHQNQHLNRPPPAISHHSLTQRTRPHFGVALPYATKIQQDRDAIETPVRSMVIDEETLENDEPTTPIPAPVRVLPTALNNFAPTSPAAEEEKHDLSFSVNEPELETPHKNEEKTETEQVFEPHINEKAISQGLTARAIFSYDKADDDEIGFDVGDIITDIEAIDVGWWRGYCKGMYGLFPANYVQLDEI